MNETDISCGSHWRSRPLFFSLALLALLALIVVHYVGLTTSPPGFFVDEAGAAAHTMCLAHNLTNCNGDFLPLFSQTWGEGRVGPVFSYISMLWVLVFGGSISSFRSLSVTVTLLTLIPTALIAYHVSKNKRLVAFVVVTCLLSPWAFHSGRIAWDPPFVACFLMSSVYFLLRCEAQRRFGTCVLSAILAVIAALAYPPALAHLFFLYAIVFPWFIFKKKTLRLSHGIIFGTTFCLLLFLVLTSDLSTVAERTGTVSIFSADPRNPTANGTPQARLWQFFTNIILHLDPRYLFLTGDDILRHSVYNFGLVSWPVTIALCSLVVLKGVSLFTSNRRMLTEESGELLFLALSGYVAACMAASLTWDSLPHALRSLSGWPFLCLAGAVALERITRTQVVSWTIVLSSAIYLHSFYSYYFTVFPEQANWWFDSDVTNRIHGGSGDRIKWEEAMHRRQYSSLAKSYFRMAYWGQKPPAKDPYK